MAFDKLHPALQYHIVNSIGWMELRDVQEACIEPILAGRNIVVLAQTAGGKTEAAFFPLISRMLAEKWQGLSVLYLSPIRALLNNQEARLRQYFDLVGHRAAVWHGDVTASNKKRLLKDLPTCLLTTPESLEAILTSGRVDHHEVFKDVRAVVVDEVHAFAGDDRGTHMLALLSRISVLSGCRLQRIGLSATVGNPDDIASWLGGGEGHKGEVIRPSAAGRAEPDVRLDFVGSLENAAQVISRLHTGEKRLVFLDSRAMVEQLGARLRDLGVRTFVTHSSLSRDLRRQAETAFQEENNCVICATSALELGIDIGDLDRVVQINSPGSVAGFLQRMGRTGRRQGTTSNCLFLALDDEALLDCASLLALWEEGYVEPAAPPVLPYHIFAQQVMALALQDRGLPQGEWDRWVEQAPALHGLCDEDKRSILEFMLDEHILTRDQGVLWFGREGEQTFGRRNFMDLLSVFTSPPVMTVRHGRTDIAIIDRMPLEMQMFGPAADDRAVVLTLAGRHWLVVHADWNRSIVHVKEAQARGRTRWLGQPRVVSFELSRARVRLLASDAISPRWSNRAQGQMTAMREQYHWVRERTISIHRTQPDQWVCWTFCGTLVNLNLSAYLEGVTQLKVASGPHSLTVVADESHIPDAQQPPFLGALQNLPEASEYSLPENSQPSFKFGECVPPALIHRMIATRWWDQAGWRALRSCRIVIQGIDVR